MKMHLIIDIVEDFNYILACGLKYEDSDNLDLTRDIEKVTCLNCLKCKGEGEEDKK